MDALFEATFSLVQDAGRNLSRCGHCNRVMRVMHRPNRLHCPNCDQTFALPDKCKVAAGVGGGRFQGLSV